MLPMIEMVNRKENIHILDDAILTYNRVRVDNDDKLKEKAKLKVEVLKKINKTKPYKKLKDQRIR